MKFSIFQLVQMVFWSLIYRFTRPQFPNFRPDDVDGYYRDPGPMYDRMLAEAAPIFYSPRLMAWVVCDHYKSVFDLMRDERLSLGFKDWKYSPKIPSHKKNKLDLITDSMLMSLDKANHMRVRKFAIPAFSPRMMTKLQGAVEEIVNRNFDQIEENDVVDVLAISNAIPLEITANFVGIPPENFKEFSALSHAIMANYDPLQKIDPVMALRGIDVLERLIDQKRENPGDDFLSVITNTIDQGDRLSRDEAVALVVTLLAAGPDTTRHQFNALIYHLTKFPDVLAEVSGNLDLVEATMYESFRYLSSGHSGAARFAREDMELFGQKIKKGEMVRLMIQCGLRDPEVFENPGIMDIHRKNADKIIMFGVGPHYCLGAALASTILIAMVKVFLKRYPCFTLAEPVVYEKAIVARAMKKLLIKNDRGLTRST
jgi:cytochrome P450 enzyme